MARLPISMSWLAPPDAPVGSWPWGDVIVPSGLQVEVLGVGPCPAEYSVARVLPDGPWVRGDSPVAALAAAMDISDDEADALFYNRPALFVGKPK